MHCLCVTLIDAQDQIVNLVCEYKVNPVGIDVETPRLSWQITSNQENVKQVAYEIRVAEIKESLNSKRQVSKFILYNTVTRL